MWNAERGTLPKAFWLRWPFKGLATNAVFDLLKIAMHGQLCLHEEEDGEPIAEHQIRENRTKRHTIVTQLT